MYMLRTAAIAAAGAAVAACLYALTRRPRLAFDLPGTMSAIVARDAACTVVTVPTPQPAAGEVLIQVRATAINRLDVMQRRGKSPVPKGVTEVLGLEAAGIVVATSSAAFEVGDDVREAFVARMGEAAIWAFTPSAAQNKWCCDLYALARQQLAALGVAQVSGGEHCTYSEPMSFFSHRRDGLTGRQATVAWLA